MTEHAVVWGAGVAVCSTLGTWAALRLARHRDVIAHPNERSSHSTPTPSGGGLGLGVATVVALALAAILTAPDADECGVLLLVAASAAIACWVGWRDDVRPLRPLVKMMLLTVAAGFWAIALPISTVEVPGLGEVSLGVLSIPLTLFWLAGFANAFNFMDGIDGIAGLTALVSALVFAVAGVERGSFEVVTLGAVLAGAALGFLPWNFPRARIFMGDAGSLVLGLLLALIAVIAHAERALPFPASILLLGPFVFDSSFTLVRRGLRGEKVWQAHREHLYQRLSRLWGSHVPVSLLYAGFSTVCGVLALGYGGFGTSGRLLSLGAPLVAMLAFAVLVLVADRRSRTQPGSAETAATTDPSNAQASNAQIRHAQTRDARTGAGNSETE